MKRILVRTVLFVFFITACTPAPEPVSIPTPVDFMAPSVEMIDTFYKIINNAQAKDDLFASWDMLTNEAQCNAREKCEYVNFQATWQDSKVAYKLYDCGSDRVVAEEMRYPRDGDVSMAGEAQYWKYQLVEFDGVLMISDVRKSQVPGEDCALVVN